VVNGLKVAVDRDACCGSGNCVMTAPAVFDQDDTLGLVVLLDPYPTPGQHAAVARRRTSARPAPSPSKRRPEEADAAVTSGRWSGHIGNVSIDAFTDRPQ